MVETTNKPTNRILSILVVLLLILQAVAGNDNCSPISVQDTVQVNVSEVQVILNQHVARPAEGAGPSSKHKGENNYDKRRINYYKTAVYIQDWQVGSQWRNWLPE